MLLIGVILILGIFAVAGWRKGVIRIVLSLASILITIIAAVIVAPLATSAVKSGTNLDENLSQSIYDLLSNNKEIDNYFLVNQGNLLDVNVSQISSYSDEVNKVIGEVGNRINLPESLTDAVKAIPESELADVITDYTSTSVKEITLRIISVRLANIVLTAIIYIMIMVIVFIALRIVIAATGIVSRLPVIKQANKAGGVILGLLEGFVVIWLFFTVVTAISGTETASKILLQIHGNNILEGLYNCNPITKLLFNTMIFLPCHNSS